MHPCLVVVEWRKLMRKAQLSAAQRAGAFTLAIRWLFAHPKQQAPEDIRPGDHSLHSQRPKENDGIVMVGVVGALRGKDAESRVECLIRSGDYRRAMVEIIRRDINPKGQQ